jgi:hypothetical protein
MISRCLKVETIVASEVYSRDQNLGIFKTESTTARLNSRWCVLDGDKIRVSFNDIVDYESTLDGAYKEFEVQLVKGVNRIVLKR